ncbi:MAG: sulfatase-like hydrolase/transferase [Planctomycetota bacterium]|nr:sulfatase-like hydrolase/transferase [Planctomycetota bacterium]
MCKRLFLLATALAGSWTHCLLQAEEPPNIVLIFADDVGREVLGCYGGQSYSTPNLDRLSQRGVRFTNFHAAPVCHASRIMLMTGNYPSRYRFPKWGSYPKNAETSSLANVLRQAGYATAITGKWQLSMLRDDPQHPHRSGFDEYSLFGWHEGPRFWSPLIWQNGQQRQDTTGKFGPDEYVRYLTDFMKRNRERPFFALYSMALCHAVSDDFLPRPPHGPKGRYMHYAEMVEEMDRRVGQIVDAIREQGLEKRTLVFFTTDNGTTRTNFIRHEGKKLINDRQTVSKFRGREIVGAKTRFTDWGIRVPTLAVWPGKLEPGTTSEALGDLTDLLPTFAELAGSQPPGKLDGKSFAPLLRGRAESGPRQWVCVQNGRLSCVKDNRWKLISDGRLYDLHADRDEKKPIRTSDDDALSRAARSRLTTIQKQILQPLQP